MIRKLGIGTLGCAFALAMASVPRQRPASPRRPLGSTEHDSRRLEPGVHRAGPAELAVRNRVARAESLKIEERRQQAKPSVPATAWVSLGPTSADKEYNSVNIAGVDSGRPNTILVDPRDPNIVYMGVSGGGVWKTFDFLSANGPTWSPLSDTLPNLAVGALALDAAHPDTLYLGTGDFIDASGNTILKSVDGGGQWSTPVELSGTYPSPNTFAAKVGSIRSIDARGDLVLAGTDVGLFRSDDAGTSFSLVDLPNPNGLILTDTVWSVVQTGGGHWVASGVTSCDESGFPAPFAFGSDPGPGCTAGNDGEIWYSPDGINWSLATLPQTIGIGRITLAAGRSGDPTHTVVYAYVGTVDNFATLGFWRSNDGGMTWADATGTLANPTNPIDFGGQIFQDCESLNLGHDQTWYNQAIVVDPTNPDHVLVGGNLCGARTLNGTAASPKWELVSHWLPEYEGGSTAFGQLGYVHADWHTATSVLSNGVVRTFAGTDGGIFSSTDLFKQSTQAEQVTWTHHNRGLVTHLIYAIASGDPVTGNPFVLFGGLQDNGTRFRADPHTPSVFNQPVGGDGIGATVHVSSSGTTYWASVEFGHVVCQPKAGVDCADGENWTFIDPVIARQSAEQREDHEREHRGPQRSVRGGDGEDSEPFFVHYANVETDVVGQSVLTHTDGQVFVSSQLPDGTFTWTPISQDLTLQNTRFSNVAASRTTPGVYGGVGSQSGAPFFFTTTGNTPSVWRVTRSVFATATGRMTGPSSMDFPPVLPAGTMPGQVFIGSFTGTLNDADRTPPPDKAGHLYRTTDFGQTWLPIVGNDPAHQLPNVPVYVAKYDPVTPTTIYAGTDLGVYLTTDDGVTWDRMGEGFPVVPARDLYVAKNQDFIRVATYGRGIWEIYPSAGANQGTPGNGDYDRNLRLDWIDLAAMSSRLGVTPEVTTQPFYSWIMDITGVGTDTQLQKIDDADLDALLAKFGGHP